MRLSFTRIWPKEGERVIFPYTKHVALAGLLAGAMFAQTTDPSGWRKARWGMLPKAIEAVQPGARILSGDPLRRIFGSRLSTFGVEGIPVGSAIFDAFMFFDGSQPGLTTVILQPRAVSPVIFTEIEESLTVKYGKPSLRDARESKIREVWRLPTTTIELSASEVLGQTVGLRLTYGRKTAKPDGNL